MQRKSAACVSLLSLVACGGAVSDGSSASSGGDATASEPGVDAMAGHWGDGQATSGKGVSDASDAAASSGASEGGESADAGTQPTCVPPCATGETCLLDGRCCPQGFCRADRVCVSFDQGYLEEACCPPGNDMACIADGGAITCTNSHRDNLNCGRCGQVCTGGTVCTTDFRGDGACLLPPSPDGGCTPTYYPSGQGCGCAQNAYPAIVTDAGLRLDPGAPCMCEFGYNGVCPDDAGAAQCVDTATDPGNCGTCGVQCASQAACIPVAGGDAGSCGPSPVTLVASTPGCMPMTTGMYPSPNPSPLHLAVAMGSLFWSDALAGTVSVVPTTGGEPVVLAPAEASPTGLVVDTGAGPTRGALYWIDQGTNTIRSLPPGTSVPETVVQMAPVVVPWDAGPSPYPPSLPTTADNDAGVGIIHGVAVSPDGATVYFSAGTNIYSVPAAGGATDEIGYSAGPAHGVPNALRVDAQNAYYASSESGNVELMSLSVPCTLQAAEAEMCPLRIAEGQGSLLLDTIALLGDDLYWANGSSVQVASISSALTSGLLAADTSPTVWAGDITGFAVGTANVYLGEDGTIERTSNPTPGLYADSALTTVIARGQPLPSSFAVDGQNVYWTTSRCDIVKLADSPQ